LLRETGDQVIYRISEEQAFTTAVDVFAEVLPHQSLFDVAGPRRGYQATWRFGLDTFSQRVLVVPAIGIARDGSEVRGYWFDVSGSGSAVISGPIKNRKLYHRLKEALDATGTGAVVTNVRDGQYETDGRAYRVHGVDASKAAAGRSRAPASAPSGGPADLLRELKSLHDQGLITKDEYELKRRQILDRM
jgi:hypothetical protein